MTYETGTASDLEDLYSKLDIFAQTTHGGWSSIYTSNPDTTNRWFELNKGSLSFSSKYPASVGDGDSISIHQATGSTSALTAPGAHTADSGNGYNATTSGTSANFEAERCVHDIGNGTFPSYHFFADTTTGDYIYCVIETSTGVYRHFGFGTLAKFGDNWVGGEFVYGHYHTQSTNTHPTNSFHQCFLDGLATTQPLRAATIRIASGLANQSPAVWGNVIGSTTTITDTAGIVRRQIHGTWRAGMEPRGFGNPVGNTSSGVIPMYSIGAYYREVSTTHVYLLGYMADVRAMNIRNFEVASTITIGSDSWVIFPQSQKSIASAITDSSDFSGIAYRKVT